jgi:hypothetical protein
MAINAGITDKFTTFRNEAGLFCIMFQHSHGIKWSKILARGRVQQIETLFKHRITYSITPTTVIITFLDKYVIDEMEIKDVLRIQ